MFKSQLKFQKIICFVALIMAAILFAYALGFITEFYELFSPTIGVENGTVVNWAEDKIKSKNDLSDDYQLGNDFYLEMQTYVTNEPRRVMLPDGKVDIKIDQVKHVGFNDRLVSVALIGLVVSLLLFITSCNKRRNYYVSNFVAIGATSIYNVGFAAWLIANVAKFEAMFNAVDHQALIKWFAEEKFKTDMEFEVICFTLGYVVAALLIVVTLLLVFNLIWKITLMKREHKLLQNNAVQEVSNA